MKKQKITFLIVLGIFSFSVFSCSNYSVFEKFDKPNTEKISKLSGYELIVALEKNQGSKVFYSALTQSKQKRILSSLDDIINTELNASLKKGSKPSAILARSALAAADLIIHTDSLVYALIFNLIDPFFVVFSDKNVTLENVFYTFTEPLQKVVSEKQFIEKIALCFYNLYRITVYYNKATLASEYASYSGADLQKYVISGIVSGVLAGTAKAINSSYGNLEVISKDVADAYAKVVQSEDKTESILTEVYKQLKSELNISESAIIAAYKKELLEKADILDILAVYAGFDNVARVTSDMLRRWGMQNE